MSLFILEWDIPFLILCELLFDLFKGDLGLALFTHCVVQFFPVLLSVVAGVGLILDLFLQLIVVKHHLHVLLMPLQLLVSLIDLLHDLLHLFGVACDKAKRAILKDNVILLQDAFDLGS